MVLRKWTTTYGVEIGAKMGNPPLVVVDADAIIAQADPNDYHHHQAASISDSLAALNATVVYPATAITEATAYMQRVLNSTASAYGTAVVLTDVGVQVAPISQKILKDALNYFSPTTSKKNTLFDCVVAAVAEEYEADAIFSFDKFYKRKGFKLASELELTDRQWSQRK